MYIDRCFQQAFKKCSHRHENGLVGHVQRGDAGLGP